MDQTWKADKISSHYSSEVNRN